MKLLNYTTAFFAVILLVIIPVWAALFYYNMLDEIYDSMDDGLDNQKLLVLQKARTDSAVFRRTSFEEGDYTIREIPAALASPSRDVYMDTLMYMRNEDEFEPVRMLRTVFAQNNRYYELKVITSMVEEDDLINQLLYSLLWLYLGLVATILVLNNVLLRRIWQPFYRLLRKLKSFRLEAPHPVGEIDTRINEFRLLNETVQKLLKGNIAAYNSQKQFIENAAHELQTPLAICLNKLELFVERYPLSDEQLGQLGSVMNGLQRAARLNQSLLLLSRIENQQFDEGVAVNLNELARQVVNDFAEQAAYKQVSVSLQEEGACTVTMHPDLAGVLLTNLVKNAIVHNVAGGWVQVVLRPGSFEVRNSGSPTPLDRDRIFNRFYKEQSSSASTGLGLSIVKAIADMYGFEVSYAYRQEHVVAVVWRGSLSQ
jgi:signal transduction histidine kinase